MIDQQQAPRARLRGFGDTDIESALLMDLHERISPADIRLLEHCWGPCDVEVAGRLHPQITPYQTSWLVHYKLLTTRVDSNEVLWLETTQLGRDLVRYYKKFYGKKNARRA